MGASGIVWSFYIPRDANRLVSRGKPKDAELGCADVQTITASKQLFEDFTICAFEKIGNTLFSEMVISGRYDGYFVCEWRDIWAAFRSDTPGQNLKISKAVQVEEINEIHSGPILPDLILANFRRQQSPPKRTLRLVLYALP
ncbi:MAG: hypothetical protein AAFN59_10620 [Pseudomonadota bacterium]